MGSVSVGESNVSPIELGRRRHADPGLRRRTFAAQRTTLTIEPHKDHAEPGRRSLGLAGRFGCTIQTRPDARKVNPELRAATAKGADLLYSDGEVDAAHRVLKAAIDTSLARPDHDLAGLLQALHTLSAVCYFGDRGELWVAFQQALDLLGDVVPPLLRFIAQSTLDPVAASAAVIRAVELHATGRQAGDADPAQTVQLAMAAHVVGRLPDCRNALQQLFLGVGAGNAGHWAVRAGLLLAADAVDEGQWAEAEALADECIGLCENSGQQLWVWFGRRVLALVAAGRGQWNNSLALTNEVVEWARPRGVRRLISDAQHVRSPTAPGQVTHQDAVSIIIRRSPRRALQAANTEALVAPDERATELFRAALQIPGIERWPFDVARVQLAFGERLRRLQATRAAREQLTAALDTFSLLGAQPWAERAAAELRATGQTRHRTDGSSPAPLTPQELGIAELAATGLTNKQIGIRLYLSPRTVSAHLYRVFPKLGITSRAALRDALLALPAHR